MEPTGPDAPHPPERTDFIREMIAEDLRSGKHTQVVTRFPPEPNGYLHIGHSKAILLNYGIAQQFGGRFNLRFDDTNPETEEVEYTESILADVRWLGADWGDRLYYASDYFDRMYDYAVELIRKGLAYVDSSSLEEIRRDRGTVNEAGRESPHRGRSVAENLDLFARMKQGEFPDGAHVLRAKGDMASANMKMRDPLLYRIRNVPHYRQGAKWHIYPMYDFAHPLEDSVEGVTHSLCTLEFENNREIYDWVLDHLDVPQPRPRQTEFARLNISYTVMSKRKLLQLVKERHVAGWDDPRMPTLAGLRRRGVRPSAIRAFNEDIGVAKANSTVEIERLEAAIRDDLNHAAPRVMAVLDPLHVVIENWPEDRVEQLDASYWPRDVPREGTREVPFGRELFIERGDFMEHPPKGFHRLSPGGEVRLRYGYVIRCEGVVRDAGGQVTGLRCTYDPATSGGASPEGRKVKGTIQWVSAAHALDAEVRVYDRLFTDPRPDTHEDRDFLEFLNPASLETVRAKVEPSLAAAEAGAHFQFERQGYFVVDAVDSKAGAPVFNRTVGLRDSWAKVAAQAEPAATEAADAAEARAARKAGSAAATAREIVLDETGRRYRDEYGLAEDDARVLSEREDLRAFFEAALAVHQSPKSVANWMINELLRVLKDRRLEDLPFGPTHIGELARLVDEGTITSRAGKDVFEELLATGDAPGEIVERRGLRQVRDEDALGGAIDAVIAAHPEEVARYREGKTGLMGFFMGQVMKATRGQASPDLVKELLARRLSS